MKPSKGEYPHDWELIALRVKERADWCCIRCGHAHEWETGYVLTVHHLDSDKSNCAWWNLVALCQRCHLSIQGRVILERPWIFDHTEWFKPYVAGYYASVCGRPTDREYVLSHVEELLAEGQGR